MNLPFFALIKLYLWSSFIAKVHWGHTETRSKPINKSNECQHNESEMWHRLRSRINIDLQTMPWGKWLCWSYCAETMLNLPAGVCSVHCHHQLASELLAQCDEMGRFQNTSKVYNGCFHIFISTTCHVS